MAYSNLTTFCSALASYGKNFQQYLDGHPSLTVRQGAGTDIVNLAKAMTGFSGNSTDELQALATTLSRGREVQDELSHTALANRNLARTQWTQVVTDFNAIETAEGETPGDYSAATLLVDAVLAAGMPNDLGQWSDKLTTSQMANAATAIQAMSDSDIGEVLTLYQYAPALWLDSDIGIVPETGTGTGSDLDIQQWISRDVNQYDFEFTTGPTNPPELNRDRVNGHNSLIFSSATDQGLVCSSVPLTGSSGVMFFVSRLVSSADVKTLYSQGKSSGSTPFASYSWGTTEKVQTNVNDGSSHTNYYGTAPGSTEFKVTEIEKDPSDTRERVHTNGTENEGTTGSNHLWAGSVGSLCNIASVGGLGRSSFIEEFDGEACAVYAVEEHPGEAAKVAIRQALATRYGITLA